MTQGDLACTSYAGGGNIIHERWPCRVPHGHHREPSSCNDSQTWSPSFSCEDVVTDFLLPGLDGVVFVAWGSTDGMVYVGYYLVPAGEAGLEAGTRRGGSGGLSSSSSSAAQRIELRTVLRLPLLCDDCDGCASASPIRHVVYGGGSKALLLAASDTAVAVFTLESLLYEMVNRLESNMGFFENGMENDALYRVCERTVCVARDVELDEGEVERVVAVGWTGQGDGVVVSSGTTREMHSTNGHSSPSPSPYSPSSGSSAYLRMWEVGDDRMELLWSTRTEGVQRVVHGGVSVYSPCVTATRDDSVASVWWYDSMESTEPNGPREASVVNENDNEKKGCIRLEQLKHPTVVKDVEWSAGVLRKDASVQRHQQDEGQPVKDHPAIMTIDRDGCVRIWVEMMVMMSSSFDCYFAMNLVIPPRAAGGDTRAMWVKPVDHVFQRHLHHMNAHDRVLWLIVACKGTLSLYALRGLAPVVVSAALTSPRSGSRSSPLGPSGGGVSHSVHEHPKKPQFLLWGEYVWDGLLGSTNMRLSARMLHGDDFPVVECVTTEIDNGGNFVLTSGVSLVTMLRGDMSKRLQSSSGIQQGIHLERAWSGFGRLRGHDIVSTLVMRRFLVLLDARGCLDVWRIGAVWSSLSPGASSTGEQDSLMYYGSLPLGDRFRYLSDLSASSGLSMIEVTGMPKGYDSVVLVAGGCRRVVQVSVAIAPDQKDIFIAGVWRVGGTGAIHERKNSRDLASLLVTSLRGGDGHLILQSYGGFLESRTGCDENQCTDENEPELFPTTSFALPIVLEDSETIVHVQDVERGRPMMVGTSTGRIIMVDMHTSRRCGRNIESVPPPGIDANTTIPASASTGLSMDDVEVFSIDRFSRLEFDSSCGLLAAVHAPDDNTVSLYKMVVGEMWRMVPCGEIRCPTGVVSATWMVDEILPCLSIGDRKGWVTMFALDNTKVDSWSSVASFRADQGRKLIDLSYGDSCLVCTSGRSSGIIGPRVREPNGHVRRLGKALFDVSGPLPPYHPDVLKAMVLSGHVSALFEVLHAFKTWLETIDSDAMESLECCSHESSELLSPGAEQARARAMPNMFPAVSPAIFISRTSTDVSKILENLRGILRTQGEREYVDTGAHACNGVTPDAPESGAAASHTIPSAPSFESGMLDMSAFGMDMPPVAPALAPPCSHESGLLDMGAFGVDDPTTSAVEPKPTEQKQISSIRSLESGMLDLSAFGMDLPAGAPPQSTASATTPHQSHDAGILEMGAFGMEIPATSKAGVSLSRSSAAPQESEHVSTVKHRKPCITLQSSTTTSTQQCSEFLALLDELIGMMQSPQPNAGSTPNTRYVPGLCDTDTARLDASIRRTKEVLAEIRQDVDAPTLIFLLSLAWSDAYTTGNTNALPLNASRKEDGDGDPVERRPSFVNAAGVPMDYDRLKKNRSTQPQPATGLSATLGLGPLVSPESLVWICLSSQDGSQALSISKLIQEKTCGFGETPVNKPHARNSSNMFLAIPQTTGEAVNTWESLRSTGLAFWQRDRKLLVSLMEETAKATFRESRDPDKVALIYAAIGKISVLRGLYRTCNRMKEAEFFSRDFSLENNRIAANKNAFVLLGQHRYAMAATFFILGGKLRDAVEVCLHQMRDFQLAIVLYRTLGEDIDVDLILQEALKPHEHLSVAHFLRHWVLGNLVGAVESMLTMRQSTESFWLVQALMHLGLVFKSHPGSESLEKSSDVDPISKLSMVSTLSADILSRNAMPLLALELEHIASISSISSNTKSSVKSNLTGKKAYTRWKNEASLACAFAMIEAPVSLIPDIFAEDDFNKRIAQLMSRVKELQNLGVEVSTNVVLHRVESIYKSLSFYQTIAAPGTPRSSMERSLSGISGAFGALALGRTHSLDAQSGNSNQTNGVSSVRRTSLDDVHEHQQLAKMVSRSKMMDSTDEDSTHIIYPKGVEIFRVDGDAINSVCSCPLLAPDVCGRLVAVATPKNGIMEFATHPDVAMDVYNNDEMDMTGLFRQTSQCESPKHDSGMFSKLVSQIFDQTSWMTDPLENQSVMIDGDVGLATRVGSERTSTIRSPRSSPLADAKTTVSKMLVAHPYRQLFLSGCKDTARIKLWQYDGPRPLRLFTPVPRHDLEQLASMNHDMFSMSSNFAKSRSLASKMSHWGKAADVCFSENGDFFASIGQGGVVAVWNLNSAFDKDIGTDVDGATCSEWWHICLEAEGRSVAFVGGSSAVVAAAGQCKAGNVSLWNTSLPENQACIGRLRHHKSTVNKIHPLPGGWLLAMADDAGLLSVCDLRMLGSDREPILWTVRACKGAIRAMDNIMYEPNPVGYSFKHRTIAGNDTAIVTGGDDGIIRLWDVNSGTLLQQSERIHSTSTPKSSRAVLSLSSPASGRYCINDLAVCEEGVITAGNDGVVRLFPRES